jgi:hypothetical protein
LCVDDDHAHCKLVAVPAASSGAANTGGGSTAAAQSAKAAAQAGADQKQCWCIGKNVETTGLDVCGYPEGYNGTYFSILPAQSNAVQEAKHDDDSPVPAEAMFARTLAVQMSLPDCAQSDNIFECSSQCHTACSLGDGRAGKTLTDGHALNYCWQSGRCPHRGRTKAKSERGGQWSDRLKWEGKMTGRKSLVRCVGKEALPTVGVADVDDDDEAVDGKGQTWSEWRVVATATGEDKPPHGMHVASARKRAAAAALAWARTRAEAMALRSGVHTGRHQNQSQPRLLYFKVGDGDVPFAKLHSATTTGLEAGHKFSQLWRYRAADGGQGRGGSGHGPLQASLLVSGSPRFELAVQARQLIEMVADAHAHKSGMGARVWTLYSAWSTSSGTLGPVNLLLPPDAPYDLKLVGTTTGDTMKRGRSGGEGGGNGAGGADDGSGSAAASAEEKEEELHDSAYIKSITR